MLLLLASCTVAASPPPPEPVPVVVPEPAPPAPEPLPETGPFSRELVPGLTVAAYLPPDVEDPGFSRPDPAAIAGVDPRLYVVTLDPAHFELVYLSALTGQDSRQDARAWAEAHELSVVFNPGMFEPDGRATGYTRSGTFVSQPRVRRQGLYRGWFAVGPAGAATLDQVPPKASGDYVDFEALPEAFRTRLDGFELVSQSLAVMRDGKGVYPPRKNQWSELAYGTDDQGRVVVVFTRHPYEMRELGVRLEALDLGIDGLVHGEGGPEASLVVRAGGVELVKMGSYETGFSDDSNHHLWTLPAVLGARPRR